MMKHLIVALLMTLPMVCLGQTSPQSPYESVKESTDLLLNKLKEVQPLYETDPEKFYAEVQRSLNPYVDFEGFAKRVMAKHYRKATDEQKVAFVEQFKQALMRTYATALVGFDNEKVVVIDPSSPPEDDRATILIEVHAKSGTIFPVQYQLELSDGPDDRRWLLRNVIINGINIGLQFRSQFNAYMQKYRMDIDSVIDNWSVDTLDQS